MNPNDKTHHDFEAAEDFEVYVQRSIQSLLFKVNRSIAGIRVKLVEKYGEAAMKRKDEQLERMG